VRGSTTNFLTFALLPLNATPARVGRTGNTAGTAMLTSHGYSNNFWHLEWMDFAWLDFVCDASSRYGMHDG